MMPEYIKSKALLNALKEERKNGNFVFTSKWIKDIMDNLPTADVVEVKHGEWKPVHYEGGFIGTNYEECSICRYRIYFNDMRCKLTFDYCPKCGAKMDEKEGSEE